MMEFGSSWAAELTVSFAPITRTKSVSAARKKKVNKITWKLNTEADVRPEKLYGFTEILILKSLYNVKTKSNKNLQSTRNLQLAY